MALKFVNETGLSHLFSLIKTAVNGKADTDHTHNYAGSDSAGGSANSAVKLDSSAGSVTQPVYFADGKPVATTYSLEASVPSGAKFTDTTYSEATTSDAGLMSAADKTKLDALSASDSNAIYYTVTVATDGTSAIDFPDGITEDSVITVYQDGILLLPNVHYTLSDTQIVLSDYTANAGSLFTIAIKDVSATGYEATALPNPYTLTFTGGVTGEYDGSVAVTVEIPEGVPTYSSSDSGKLLMVNTSGTLEWTAITNAEEVAY